MFYKFKPFVLIFFSFIASFPAIALELSNEEIKEWITPADLKIGNTVVLYNRRFLLYDCDEFTKGLD